MRHANSMEEPPETPQRRQRGVVGHYVQGGFESSPLSTQVVSLLVGFFGTLGIRALADDWVPDGALGESISIICSMGICIVVSLILTSRGVNKTLRRIEKGLGNDRSSLAESTVSLVKTAPAYGAAFAAGAAIVVAEVDLSPPSAASWAIMASITAIYGASVMVGAGLIHRALRE